MKAPKQATPSETSIPRPEGVTATDVYALQYQAGENDAPDWTLKAGMFAIVSPSAELVVDTLCVVYRKSGAEIFRLKSLPMSTKPFAPGSTVMPMWGFQAPSGKLGWIAIDDIDRVEAVVATYSDM